MRTVSCIADAAHDGARVYDVLREQLGASDGSVRRAKHISGGLLLEGNPTWTKARVRAGQEVAIVIEAPGLAGCESAVAPEDDPVSVVYADADVLVVEKPAGLVMYPGPSHPGGTLANRLAGWIAAQGRQCGLQAVHRLDRGTSGLVVFALNSYVKDRLQAQLHSDAFVREYLAVCAGWPDPAEGVVDVPLGKLSTSPNVFGVVSDGKPALTRYRTEEQVETPDGVRRALVRLRLKTGRTHQIRIHMAHIGCPLVGDDAYGCVSSAIVRPALHSARLAFDHPVTGTRLEFESPLPEDMCALL